MTIVEQLSVRAALLRPELEKTTTDVERELLLLHAMAQSYMEGMDASMEIMTQAMNTLTATRSETRLDK